MSHRTYASYHDSGAKWLGLIPEHWLLIPLWSAASCNDEVLPENTHQDTEIKYIEISGVTAGVGITAVSEMTFADAPSRARRKVQNGDILVSTVRTYLRAIAQIVDPPPNLVASTGFAVLRPRSINSGFLGYAVQAEFFISEVIARSVGVSYPAINASDLVRITLPLPPLSDQAAIATFLDRETAKIDALVQQQNRLIELLKEKRQAVISHAVTKGLDPDVKMKDSGIEWLSQIPEHWEVTPFKRMASIRYGLGEPPKYQDIGTPLIRATNVSSGKIFSEGIVYVDPADIPQNRIVWLEEGDIIVVRSGAYTGDSAIVDSAYSGSIAGFDMVARVYSAVPQFVQFVLLSHYFKTSQIDVKRMRSAQPHLNSEELGECSVALPTMDDQRAIVAFLETEMAKLDALSLEANRAISLFQERRLALISAAVTGKIDVRDRAEAREAAE